MTTIEAFHLFTQPSIASAFPLKFTNGDQWDTYTGQCQCGSEIPATEIFGSVTPTFNDVYRIEGVGMCPKCRQVTAFTHTLAQGRVMSRDDDGDWVTWEAQRLGNNPLSRLVLRVRRLFSRL